MIVRSHDGKDTDNVSAVSAEHPETRRTPFVIDHAGEFEISGLFVTGIYAPKKDGSTHAIYRFDAEGLRVGFLGALDRPLKTNEVEALGPIDILLVPSGGQDVLTAAQAAEVVAQIEPRQVIPAYVGSGSYSTAESLQKALGCPSQSVNKLKIGKTNLPEDLECILFS
jgi:L-ascorbate metabolism protein UlaG (beta-lactamase superfamily)